MFRKLKQKLSTSSTTTVKRGLSLSISNLSRNPLATASTILVMTIILFLLNITLLLGDVVSNELEQLQSKVDIIVYLKDDADLLKVKELEDEVRQLEIVEKVVYTSKEEALKKFLANYPGEDNPFDKYILQNPLPADLTIVTSRAEDQQTVLDFLKQSNYSTLLESVSQSDIVNQQITRNVIIFTRSVEQFLWLLLITFGISAILIIINAIHFTIYTRKEEIEVMKLVGARPYFIKLPFLFEGMIYGFISTVLNLGGLGIISYYINGPELGILAINSFLSPLYISLEIIVALIFGLVSAWIATTLYFKSNLKN